MLTYLGCGKWEGFWNAPVSCKHLILARPTAKGGELHHLHSKGPSTSSQPAPLPPKATELLRDDGAPWRPVWGTVVLTTTSDPHLPGTGAQVRSLAWSVSSWMYHTYTYTRSFIYGCTSITKRPEACIPLLNPLNHLNSQPVISGENIISFPSIHSICVAPI